MDFDRAERGLYLGSIKGTQDTLVLTLIFKIAAVSVVNNFPPMAHSRSHIVRNKTIHLVASRLKLVANPDDHRIGSSGRFSEAKFLLVLGFRGFREEFPYPLQS